jgi:uncharacterized protein with von Willebrand factor type A (vWA) domain
MLATKCQISRRSKDLGLKRGKKQYFKGRVKQASDLVEERSALKRAALQVGH